MPMTMNSTMFSALNGSREKRAKANIHHAANWIIGGLENAQLDHPVGTQERTEADEALSDHAGLVQQVYCAATTELYDEGFCGWGPDVEAKLKDLRLLGKAKLMQLVEAEVTKQGY